tara:strand:+ start:23566 stop:23700 length:135 start_codon:yes stop_codon:yes gene_type:complete
MKQYPQPKITEKIIIRKIKEKTTQAKKNKYLDHILSKKFLKSYF